MPRSLQETTAIVTGGSRGIGAGIAVELASRGANVLITYQSASKEAEEVAGEIRDQGGEVLIVQAGGSNTTGPTRIVEAAMKQWTKIDIIVNNAGAGDDCLLKDMTYELWDKLINCDIPQVVGFLCEEGSRWSTGSTVNANGGLSFVDWNGNFVEAL